MSKSAVWSAVEAVMLAVIMVDSRVPLPRVSRGESHGRVCAARGTPAGGMPRGVEVIVV